MNRIYAKEKNHMKILIAYYSRADQNYVNGNIVSIAKGNTEKLAEIIQKEIGGDLFKIEQLIPYSKDYSACIQEAQDDKHANKRPQLKEYHDISEYDEIYLGYPNYWGTCPMAVFTFLEKCHVDGKVIHPFCTHEGSGMGNSVSDLKKELPNSTIEEGLPIYGSKVEKSITEIREWLK